MTEPLPPDPLPPDPLTGTPALERVADLSPKLLADLWRLGARVVPSPLRPDGPRLGLFRGDSGLLFFHPAVAGDGAFYDALYRRFRAHELLSARAAEREDFRAGAAVVRPGDRVLDVGCGHGAFAALVPQARYQGLEPHTATPADTGPAPTTWPAPSRCWNMSPIPAPWRRR